MIPIMLVVIALFTPTPNAIINSSYYNISSYSQLYQLTNASTGGLEEVVIMVVLFFVMTGGATIVGKFNPLNSALGASIIMVVITLLAQSVFLTSGGTVAAVLPLIFIGLTILLAMVNLLVGFKSPYG